MNLVQMSVSGAVMILVTVVFRSLFIHHLPKRTFLFMWSVVMVRLLIPFSLPCVFSAYSFFTRKVTAEEIPQNITVPPLPDFFMESSADLPAVPVNAPSAVPPPDTAIDTRTAVWLTGVLLCFVFFAVSYVKSRMKFRESLPVDNEYINQWLAENKIFRRISVRCSDRISTPLTYGVFRPVILLPKNFRQLGNDDLKFVLTHEYVHIRRFDAVFKLALIAALCVHWFNPMVWVMFIIANRDIEISCDEAVIRMLGDCEKQTYAMTLIRMEERKSGLFPLNSNFSQNAIKERIVAIMKFKKATALTVIASACLVAGTTTVFATSAPTLDDVDTQISISDGSIPESRPTDDSSNSETEFAEKPEKSDTSTEPTDSTADPADTQIPVDKTPNESGESHNWIETSNGEKIIVLEPDEDPPFLNDGNYIVQKDIDEGGNRIARYTRYTGAIPESLDHAGFVVCAGKSDNGDTVLNIIILKETDIVLKPVTEEHYTHEEILDDGILRW